ncbi:IS66 family transposase [uncultured Azohydromonas sp.]|jgi:Transposase and inactivated derivatives|uniref:IS66 family transposase n=1 Tax=uncultured Azohydromonas sp. TaxID=487342 RepID=UPI0026124FBE|nr:IS66 family transposase [uncultured Azohydromonas sp.]
MVTLTKQEHIRLVMEAHYWKSLHERAVVRLERQRQQFQHDLALARQREAELREQLEHERACNRDLRQRVFGQHTEQSRLLSKVQQPTPQPKRPRGQQPGAPGHGRTRLTQLPAREETIELEPAVCPQCGLALKEFPGTQDCEVVEYEVSAWRRVIHRRRYCPTCRCGCLPGIVTAPAPPRLIPMGKLGVSAWVHLLLGKFLHAQPLHRLLQDWEDQGLHLSPGTATEGLHRLAVLFEPLQQALHERLRAHTHWHADETRWEVFAEQEGKVGHRWYLWVFHTPTVAYYVLDPSRSSKVPGSVLEGVDAGILSVDRYAAYKKYATSHPGVQLSFCWAHQRRDFLRVANDHPVLWSWAMGWVQRISELYKLHALRQEAGLGTAEFTACDERLRQAVQVMQHLCEQSLADKELATAARKVLKSLQRHWAGLVVFVEQSWLPLDNNAAERALRLAVVGRKNFYGSGSQWSGEMAATLMSLLMTVKLWKINARTWLSAYLNVCANEGGKPPSDISAFIPWQMNEAQLAAMRAAPAAGGHGFDTS